MTNNFTHLHVHSMYSLLDGFAFPEDLAKRAKELGMKYLAVTDHNHMLGVNEFLKACKKEGVKPILGCEMYYTEDTDILSLPAAERNAIAVSKAEEDGVEIPKKITKKERDKLLKDYIYDTSQYHLIVLAKNQIGYSNLCKLQSEASHKCTFNGRYLCDLDMLRKYSEGLIITSACIGGYIPRQINRGHTDIAEKHILDLKEIFKDDFYIELQPLQMKRQCVANLEMIKLADKHDIKIVSTSDVHYTYEEDHDLHDTLMCMQIQKQKNDMARMIYSNDFWLRSYDEMIEAYNNQIEYMKDKEYEFDESEYMDTLIESLEETNRVAEKIEEVVIGSDKPILPNYRIPEEYSYLNYEEYLSMLTYNNLYKYANKKESVKKNIKEYEKRVLTELDVINPKGFAPYFLIVADYINYCDNNNIGVGPSRGSAGGSLVSFLTGISKVIDPIEYGLLFFRFMTKDRTAMPDIDSDFADTKRYRVVDYLKEKYGEDNVCSVGTVSTYGVKNNLKDVGKALGYPFSEMNKLTKSLDSIIDSPSLKFKHFDALEKDDPAKYKEFKEIERRYSDIFETARRFEGVPKSVGTHASAHLITPNKIVDDLPTRYDAIRDKQVTLFSGEELESLGYIKFDLLGLNTLSIIEEAIEDVDEFDSLLDIYEKINLEDKSTYKMIRNRDVVGTFQMESDLFKSVIGTMKPTEFMDIVALNALCRPGPLSVGSHERYSKRKNKEEKVTNMIHGIEDITDISYGTICYQETLMLIAQRVAKFDGNQSDTYLRKSVAKGKGELMNLCRQWFIYGKVNEPNPDGTEENDINRVMYDPECKYGAPILGGVNNGYTEDELIKFWDSIKKYSSYLFNLSHAAAYSVISFITAYIKNHYPLDYMKAFLNAQDKIEDIEKYSTAVEDMGINILPPDINISDEDFSISDDSIVFGLSKIKGVKNESVKYIKENRPYESLEDIMTKIPKKFFNKTVGKNLIKSSAFDSINNNRYELLNEFYDIRKDKDDRLNPEEYDKIARMEMEKEVIGITLSDKEKWRRYDDGAYVTLKGCTLKNISKRKDRKGNEMMFVTVLYETSEIDALMFATAYSKVKNRDKILKEGVKLDINGKKDENKLFINSVTLETEKSIPMLVL